MLLAQQLSEKVDACFTGLGVQSHEQEDALAEIAQLCRDENWRLATATRPIHARPILQIPQTNLDASLRMPIEHNRGTENNMTVLRKGAIEAYEIVPPGQNAFIAPDGSVGRNYDDQFEMYETFGRKRVWFYRQDVEANKVSEVYLSY